MNNQQNANWSVNLSEDSALLWSRNMENGTPGGLTALTYRKDGTLLRLKSHLEEALDQISAEITLGVNDLDRVANRSGVAHPHIEGDIPVA